MEEEEDEPEPEPEPPPLKPFSNPFPLSHADPVPPPPSDHPLEKMTSDPPSFSAAVDSINTSLSHLSSINDHHQSYSSNVQRRFSGFAQRLQLAVNQLLRSSPSPDGFPASVHTAVKGIAVDLAKAVETASVYRTRSKIFVLINCVTLCAELQERTLAIFRWLNLLESAIVDLPELRKKIADLSLDMKQANFTVRFFFFFLFCYCNFM